MAQSQSATARQDDGGALDSSLLDPKYQVQQYEKIVKFCNSILLQQHPTIKLPPGQSESTTTTTIVSQDRFDHGVATSKSTTSSDANYPKSTDKTSIGRSEINPILLEKSDALIQAEIQLERQRLEQALREDLEEHRAAKKGLAETNISFDLSKILATALVIAKGDSIAVPAGNELTNANEDASDSFDDNTFYSSQDDTVESQQHSLGADRVATNTQVQVRDNRLTDGIQKGPQGPSSRLGDHPPQPPAATASEPRDRSPSYSPSYSAVLPQVPAAIPSNLGQVPGLNNYTSSSSHVHSQQPNIAQRTTAAPINLQSSHEVYVDGGYHRRPSPHVQITGSWNLSSGSATAGTNYPGSVPARSGETSQFGTPSQVAALRRAAPNAGTSPDSSSQGGRASDKKKGKKKKRKADKQAADREFTSHIKTEPQSPSPVGGPSFLRPNKRQKQTLSNGQDALYDPRHADLAAGFSQDRPSRYAAESQARAASTAVVGPVSYIRGQAPRWVEEGGYLREQPVYTASSPRYLGGESIPQRSVSHVVQPDSYRDSRIIYGDTVDGTRYGIRPAEADRYHEVSVPSRVFVDGYGREYIEPAPRALRQSVAPIPRAVGGGGEIAYESLSQRPMSRQRSGRYYDDGSRIVYTQQPAAPYSPRRRIVSGGGEYWEDHRESRYRSYSEHPAGSSRAFVQVPRPAVEPFHANDAHAAANTIAVGPNRHEVSQIHDGRPLVQPAPRPGTTVEGFIVGQPYLRTYSALPAEANAPLEPVEYGMPAPERYGEAYDIRRADSNVVYPGGHTNRETGRDIAYGNSGGQREGIYR